MKKLFIIIICIFLITGCKEKKQESLSITEFYPTYNSIDIKPGTFFNNIIASIGNYNDVRIEPSNYYEGDANIYEYDTFEVETYYDDEIEKIYSIRITSEEQTTNENIKIGNTKKDMISVYGENYQNIEDTIFIYKLANTNLSFTIENDIIIEIVYYLS